MTYFPEAVVLASVVVAAVTDIRTGHIPNWLTFPTIGVGLLFHALTGGLQGFLGAFLGMLFCGLIPYVFFRFNAMGGGDVKLFAAIGSLVGVYAGLQTQMFSFIAAGIWVYGKLAFQGRLLENLRSSVFVILNPILPRNWRREVGSEARTTFRLGGAIAVGAMASLVFRLPTGLVP